METGQASRTARAVPLLLVAATVAGINCAAWAAFSLLDTIHLIRSLEDDVGVPSGDFDFAREFAFSEMWTEGPVLIVGLMLAIFGSRALRKRHGMDVLHWRHVVAGAVVAVLLTYVLAFLVPGALIELFDLGPLPDGYE